MLRLFAVKYVQSSGDRQEVLCIQQN